MRVKVEWWRYAFAVVAFWALSLFGGVIPMLWNELAPRFSRYMPGDLGYLILQIASNPIGSALAVCAHNYITKDAAPLCGIVNCVTASVILAAIILLGFALAALTWAQLISMALMAAVYIWNVVNYCRDMAAAK